MKKKAITHQVNAIVIPSFLTSKVERFWRGLGENLSRRKVTCRFKGDGEHEFVISLEDKKLRVSEIQQNPCVIDDVADVLAYTKLDGVTLITPRVIVDEKEMILVTVLVRVKKGKDVGFYIYYKKVSN